MPNDTQNRLETVVFFDGVCNFCNASVDFLARRDPRHVLKYASLQGETARRILPPELVAELSTVSLWKGGKLYFRSSAILQALVSTGGMSGILGKMGLFVPAPVRDFVYDIVARNRYRWFGKRDTCRLPSMEERDLFLP